MKRKFALVLAAAVAVSAASVNSFADDEYPEVALVIDGEAVESDQPAVIVDSRTMVPVRVIAEALGCEVNWDGETKTAVFEKGSLSVSLTIGDTVVNAAYGEEETQVEIDAAAIIINNRTMVPVRFISEFFSAEVDWDGETKTVTVTSPVLVADDATSDAAVETEEETAETSEEAAEASEDEEAEAADEEETEASEESEEETAEDSEEEASEDEEASDEEAETSEEETEAETEK